MKKFLKFSCLLICLSIALSSCGKSKKEQAIEETQKAVAKASEQAAAISAKADEQIRKSQTQYGQAMEAAKAVAKQADVVNQAQAAQALAAAQDEGQK